MLLAAHARLQPTTASKAPVTQAAIRMPPVEVVGEEEDGMRVDAGTLLRRIGAPCAVASASTDTTRRGMFALGFAAALWPHLPTAPASAAPIIMDIAAPSIE